MVLAAAMAAFPMAAAAQTPSFDFRGVPLGVSIDEARMADMSRYPDLANATLVCSGDPQVGAISYLGTHVSEAERAAGVTRCAYYNPPNVYGSVTMSNAAGLSLGGGVASYELDYAFDFFPDEAGVPRLYRIWLRTNAQGFSDIVAQLETKFGAGSLGRDEVESGLGARYSRRIVTWRRPGALLRVRERAGRIDRMDVTYTLTAIAERATAAVRTAQGQADRM